MTEITIHVIFETLIPINIFRFQNQSHLIIVMIGTFQRQSGETFLEFDNQISSEKLGIPLLASSSHHPDYLHLSM